LHFFNEINALTVYGLQPLSYVGTSTAYTGAYTRNRRMQPKAGRLTERKALAYPTPAKGYTLHWCPHSPGFGVRVTTAGARSWISERRVNGKTVRRTLGKVEGRGSISADAARSIMVDVSSELQRGIDRSEDQRTKRAERAKEQAVELLTLDTALRAYVKEKRRGKDGLPLKERTRSDYLAMLEPGGTSKGGKPYADGELFSLAAKPLAKITAEDMRKVYRAVEQRSARRATYAMQVLRAVLNWHGVKVPDNPLSKDTAGKDRIVLSATAGDPQPIPPERLHAWWKAATTLAPREAADLYRLMLLTGARGGEIKGIQVRNVDIDGARVLLPDTKNRTDHTLLLSKQAAEIVAHHANGKKPDAKLFDISDPRKALDTINDAAGTAVTGHDLRATFASVAEELVSAYVLKRMLNHADTGDVTGAHYIGKSETQLRAGWQVVADFIAGPAKRVRKT
jgi:integrase